MKLARTNTHTQKNEGNTLYDIKSRNIQKGQLIIKVSSRHAKKQSVQVFFTVNKTLTYCRLELCTIDIGMMA